MESIKRYLKKLDVLWHKKKGFDIEVTKYDEETDRRPYELCNYGGGLFAILMIVITFIYFVYCMT